MSSFDFFFFFADDDDDDDDDDEEVEVELDDELVGLFDVVVDDVPAAWVLLAVDLERIRLAY